MICGLFLTVQLSAPHVDTTGSDNSSHWIESDQRSLKVQQQINYANDVMELRTPCSGLWIRYTYNDSKCMCGDRLGGLVQCDDKSLEVQLAVCYCMTQFEEDLKA